MGPVVMRARVELRTRLRSAFLLALAIGIAGGATLAAIAGARRTDTAVSRFLAYEKPEQGGVSADPATYPRIARLPAVAASAQLARFGMLRVDARGNFVPNDTLGAIGVDNYDSGRPIVVSGRIPDANALDQVAVNSSAAHNDGIGLGDVLRFRSYGPDQAQALLGPAKIVPTGPTVTVRVVGIVRFPTDLSTAQAAPGVTYAGQDSAFFTPAFLRAYSTRIALIGGMLLTFRLHDLASLPAFEADVARITRGQGQVFTGSDDLAAAAQARHATSVEALALLLFGGLAGVVTLTLIAQAFARQVHLATEEFGSLRAMGMTRPQLVAVVVLRVAAITVVGAGVAVGVAVLASPLMPIGLARQAEVHRGVSVDGPVLLVGFGAIVLLLTAWAAIVAWRATRPVRGGAGGRVVAGRRPSRVAQALLQAGWSPSATIGTSMTFDSGGGASAVPVRTALLSAVTAVVVVAGALTFGANLSRLAEHPRLQGWNWDVAVGNPHSDDISKTAVPALVRDDNIGSVAAIAGAESVSARVGGQNGALFGVDDLKGSGLLPYTAGRAPEAVDEIAFGARTMSALHLALGDRVSVTTGGPPRTMVVTGRVLLTPSIVNDSVSLGQAAVVSDRSLRALHAEAPVNEFLVKLAPGVDRSAALAHLGAEFPGTVLPAVRPPDIENLQRVDRLPGILAGLFALIALLTVGNTLVNSVSRRRRELAVLRTIGFLKRQVSAMVAWQATTFAVLAVLVGLPIGAAVGRLAWNLVTDRLGLPADSIIPGAQLLFVALAAIVVVNIIAVFPRLLATRRPPATILHAE